MIHLELPLDGVFSANHCASYEYALSSGMFFHFDPVEFAPAKLAEKTPSSGVFLYPIDP